VEASNLRNRKLPILRYFASLGCPELHSCDSRRLWMAQWITGRFGPVETIKGVLQTPDGYWRVEAVKSGRALWYRIWHATTLVQDRAALATVERVLGEAYATLQPVDGAASEGNGVA
jgi:hypothetical protein